MARREALPAYYFAVEIDGLEGAYFRSCSGLKSEAEVQSHGEGGLNTTEHKLIGRTKYNNIVLKQGFANGALFSLRQQFVNDEPGVKIKRITGNIIQYGPGGKRAATWTFLQGWVCKWDGPEFDATKNEISIESIEIAHEGLLFRGG
jgi:phage tail-like protein